MLFNTIMTIASQSEKQKLIENSVLDLPINDQREVIDEGEMRNDTSAQAAAKQAMPTRPGCGVGSSIRLPTTEDDADGNDSIGARDDTFPSTTGGLPMRQIEIEDHITRTARSEILEPKMNNREEGQEEGDTREKKHPKSCCQDDYFFFHQQHTNNKNDAYSQVLQEDHHFEEDPTNIEASAFFSDHLAFSYNGLANFNLSPMPNSSINSLLHNMPQVASINHSPSVGIGCDSNILPPASTLDMMGFFHSQNQSPLADTFSSVYQSPDSYRHSDYRQGIFFNRETPSRSVRGHDASPPKNLPPPPPLQSGSVLPMPKKNTDVSQQTPFTMKRSIGKNLEQLSASKNKKSKRSSSTKRTLPMRKRFGSNPSGPVTRSSVASPSPSPSPGNCDQSTTESIPIGNAYLPAYLPSITNAKKKKKKPIIPKAGTYRTILYFSGKGSNGNKVTLPSLENANSINVATRGCKCKNSKCVKLYCECFQGGRICSDKCNCLDCKNTLEESHEGGERYKKIQECLEKRPDSFDVREKSTGDGCRCKKSNCIKKYCDCYRVGQFCSGICRCIDCKNTEAFAPDHDDESEYESEAEELDPSGESVAEISPNKDFEQHNDSNSLSYHHHYHHPSMTSPRICENLTKL